jgi:transketolase
MHPLKKLHAYGQSCWMDDPTRHMIASGELAGRVAEEDLRGITSNPTIFEKAISSGSEYNDDIVRLAAAGRSPAEIYEELVTADVREACDILREVFDQSRAKTAM